MYTSQLKSLKRDRDMTIALKNEELKNKDEIIEKYQQKITELR